MNLRKSIFFFFDKWQKRDAQFQRDAVSGGSDFGVHSVVHGVSVEYSAVGADLFLTQRGDFD